jgi:hypothetical protein
MTALFETMPRARGPSSESLQGRNPREGEEGGAALLTPIACSAAPFPAPGAAVRFDMRAVRHHLPGRARAGQFIGRRFLTRTAPKQL